MFKTATLKQYFDDTSGQFSILFAAAASALMMGTAVAVDTAFMQKTRSDLHQIADSAALAGAAASEMSNPARVQIVQDYIEANSKPELFDAIEGQPLIQFDDVNEEVTVAFQVKSSAKFSKILRRQSTPVNTASVASYAVATVSPVSISFALDVSGSMGWSAPGGQLKIQALKDSVNMMFHDIEAEVGSSSQINATMRTGMSAYNTRLKKRHSMNPGWRSANAAIKKLKAGGGTNSTPSMQYALAQIQQDRTFRSATDPRYSRANTKEFVIFMTDGDNNRSSSDTSTLRICDAMKTDGIEVFTVAFAAPSKGKALLRSCATQEDGHFFDASNGAAFREAFRKIGEQIIERSVRVKS